MNLAGKTADSFTTMSAFCVSNDGKSFISQSSKESELTTSNFADDRGFAGCVAIRSSGKEYSKSSIRNGSVTKPVSIVGEGMVVIQLELVSTLCGALWQGRNEANHLGALRRYP